MASTAPEVMTADGALITLKSAVEDGKKMFIGYDVTQASKVRPYHWGVAVVTEGMTKEELNLHVPDDTHLFVGNVLQTLAEKSDVTWDSLEDIFDNYVVAKRDPNLTFLSNNFIIKSGSKNKFLINDTPIPAMTKEVHSCIVNTIKDRNVVSELQIDDTLVNHILTAAGQWVDATAQRTTKEEYEKRSIVNVCVLHFPNKENDFFRMYNLEILTYLDTSRDMYQGDIHGITVIYQTTNVYPLESSIKLQSEGYKLDSIAEAIKFYTSGQVERKIVTPRSSVNWPAVNTGDGRLPTIDYVTGVALLTGDLDAFDLKSSKLAMDCDMAVSFDDVLLGNLVQMSDKTKVSVGCVVEALKGLDNVSYNTVKDKFEELAIFTAKDNHKRDNIICKFSSDKKNTDQENIIIAKRALRQWFTELVQCADIMVDMHHLTKMEAAVSALVNFWVDPDSLFTKLLDQHYKKKELINLSVLRFPDENGQYFHLYRLKLHGMIDLSVDDQLIGFTADFEDVKFMAKKTAIEALPAKKLNDALETFVKFYSAI